MRIKQYNRKGELVTASVPDDYGRGWNDALITFFEALSREFNCSGTLSGDWGYDYQTTVDLLPSSVLPLRGQGSRANELVSMSELKAELTDSQQEQLELMLQSGRGK